MATQAPTIESGWLHGVLEWFAATSELGINSSHFGCAVRTSITIRGRPETFFLQGAETGKQLFVA